MPIVVFIRRPDYYHEINTLTLKASLEHFRHIPLPDLLGSRGSLTIRTSKPLGEFHASESWQKITLLDSELLDPIEVFLDRKVTSYMESAI